MFTLEIRVIVKDFRARDLSRDHEMNINSMSAICQRITHDRSYGIKYLRTQAVAPQHASWEL